MEPSAGPVRDCARVDDRRWVSVGGLPGDYVMGDVTFERTVADSRRIPRYGVSVKNAFSRAARGVHRERDRRVSEHLPIPVHFSGEGHGNRIDHGSEQRDRPGPDETLRRSRRYGLSMLP